MTEMLRFTVPGMPATKGSARAFVVTPRGGGKARAVVTNDNPRAKGYQQTVSECASAALIAAGFKPITEGPVALEIVLYLPRPKALMTRRLAGLQLRPVTRPDWDKLARLLGDALTNVVYRDDGQVVSAKVEKHFCAVDELPRADITVRRVSTGPLFKETTR